MRVINSWSHKAIAAVVTITFRVAIHLWLNLPDELAVQLEEFLAPLLHRSVLLSSLLLS